MDFNKIGGLLMYNSYKALFSIKWKIYSIGDKPLARPIPLDVVGMFVLLLPLSLILSKPCAAILDQPYTGIVVLLNCVLTYIMMKLDPQGRPALAFLFDLILFAFKSKTVDFTGRAIRPIRKEILYWDAIDLGSPLTTSPHPGINPPAGPSMAHAFSHPSWSYVHPPKPFKSRPETNINTKASF